METNYVAMFSYTHADDAYDSGLLSKVRERLEAALRLTLGRQDIMIFQDRDDLEPGDDWEERLAHAIDHAICLIPVITPSFFASEYCRREFNLFLEKAQDADQARIIPIYWRAHQPLDTPSPVTADPVLLAVRGLQLDDWRPVRLLDISERPLREKIEAMAQGIAHRYWRHIEAVERAVAPFMASPSELSSPLISDLGAFALLVGRQSPQVVPPAPPEAVAVEPATATAEPATPDAAPEAQPSMPNGYGIWEPPAPVSPVPLVSIAGEPARAAAAAIPAPAPADVVAPAPAPAPAAAAPAAPAPASADDDARIAIAAFDCTGTTDGRFLPGAGQREWFRDFDAGPEMVVVPAGSFVMGTPPTEVGRAPDGREGPQFTVTIKRPFAVSRLAVTFADWDAAGLLHKPGDNDWGRGPQPVINVSFEHVMTYVRWLARASGKPYRLLSEAEWEYCCRAGTATPFWWGDSITTAAANYDGNFVFGRAGAPGEYRRRTLPALSFEPNPWGLYQMHGNVWEWCEDFWHPDYRGAPTDGSAWTAGDAAQRVMRGGSWLNYPKNLRAGVRQGQPANHRDLTIGFRVARALSV
jgi:formylglycine-generating enzyme required for sulfatase activity